MGKKTKVRAPMVYVQWIDSTSVTNGWRDRKEAIQDALHQSTDPIVSCGFLIAERKKSVVLSLSYDHHNDNANHVMGIPRSAIVSIVRLREK